MRKLLDIINKHEEFRRSCINLIPSENVMSELARKALASDLSHRYHHGEFYGGQKYIQELMNEVRLALSKLFKVQYAYHEPLSGNISFIAILLALTKTKDKVAILHPDNGGYPFNFKPFDRKPIYLPYNESEGTIDIDKASDLISKEKPKLIILGSSFILFPHPVKELSEVAEDNGSLVVYDGSHVLGLIAGQRFQDPLREGALVLFGSTHKTFPGPQGGVILTNDDEIAKRIKEVVGFPPTLIDNPHVNRIAALGITAQEMLMYGSEYAKRIIEVSRRLANNLHRFGLNIPYKEKGFTSTHQLLIKTKSHEEGIVIRDRLEEARIIVDSGVRIGSQEVVRRGISNSDVDRISEIISDIVSRKADPLKYVSEVIEIATKLNKVKYSITSD